MQIQSNNIINDVIPSTVLGTSYDFNALFNSQVYNNESYSDKYYSGLDSSQPTIYRKYPLPHPSRSNILTKATSNIIKQSFKWVVANVSEKVRINNRQSSRTDSEIQADNIVEDIYDTHLFLDLKFDGDDSRIDNSDQYKDYLEQIEVGDDVASMESFDSKEKSTENFHTINLEPITTRKSKGYDLNLSSLFPPSPPSVKRSINKLNSTIIADENDEEYVEQKPENQYVYSNFKSFKWWKNEIGSQEISQKRIVPTLSRHPRVIKRNRNSNNFSIDAILEANDEERLASAIIKSRKVYKEDEE
ncbi:hypothetical protein DFJ63DRAFT_335289 [Scheffersomyces coipomensis]|uniref:uncharacterized protein n=1 Tax=Scheffersomyces coipomensis TaxID=1788519 RepID=UPI00315C9B9E